jgi:hypothetical protein
MSTTQKQYFNDAQLYPLMMMPRNLVAVMGRGTGKGMIDATRQLQVFQLMEGSTTGFVSPSYKKCLISTLPSLLVHWERWGFKRDIHYTVGKKPWKALHWKDPIFTPQNWENVIGFYNGSVCQIITQDREGASNGMSLDHILIDEAKFVDYEKLKNETFQTNRGNERFFDKCPLHHGLTITCDMPVTKKGSWFLQYEKLMDSELIKVIEGLVFYQWQVKQRMAAHPERSGHYQRELAKVGQQLAFLRKQAYLYIERPSIYNLAVLGEDFIRRMKRELPPLVFATSIMCKRFNVMVDGFYNALREDVNLYVAPNRSRLSLSELGNGRVYENDCRNDSDLEPDLPLMIAFDVNNNINWLVCGQVGSDGKARVLKSFYVTYERKLDELLDDFCEYYQYHKTKEVIFFFDHTFIGNGYAINQNDDFYIFISNKLSDRGWFVDEVYIGRAMAHVDKAILINRMLAGKATHQVLINRDNNEALLLSIETAGVYMNKKDKRGEKLPESETDPLFARTDGSDAFDTLCIGIERHLPDDYCGRYSGFCSYRGG